MGQPVTKPMPTVLLTRPKAQSQGFAALLKARVPNVQIVIAPLIEIKRASCVPDFSGVSGAIFTSQNAVIPAPSVGLAAWCVGERTAQAASAVGWDAYAAKGNASSLLALIEEKRPRGRLLHMRGEISRGQIAERLRALGHDVDDAIIYTQPLLPASEKMKALLSGENPVILPLFSPRTARHFADVADVKAPLHIVALSQAVADEVRDIRYGTCEIAPRLDAEAMLDAVSKQTVIE